MNMIKPRIIVTGATGKTGSVVVSELLKAGYPVRALVHREDGRSARLKAQGAEIAVADMSDVERVANALKDVQRAYYCPPIDPYMIHGAAAFAVAAKEADIYLEGDKQLNVAVVIEMERQMERLKNKNILITGGTRGIGLASAQEFEREGARVAICGTDVKTLKEARSTLGP